MAWNEVHIYKKPQISSLTGRCTAYLTSYCLLPVRVIINDEDANTDLLAALFHQKWKTTRMSATQKMLLHDGCPVQPPALWEDQAQVLWLCCMKDSLMWISCLISYWSADRREKLCGYGIRFMKQGLTGSPTVWQRLLLVVQIRRLTFRAGLQKQNQNSQHHSRQVDSQKLALMKAGSPKYRKHKNTKHKQQKAGSKTRSTPTAKEFNSKFKAWVCEGKGRENRRREEKSKPLDELPWNLI